MIEPEDAIKVVSTLTKNLAGVAQDKKNFEKLPDSFWGYFARGHDSKGKFGIIITYSEDETDVDNLIKMYQEWVSKHTSSS